MPTITEGKLTFDFRADWQVSQYDAWVFYQKRFRHACGGSRGVDILALDPNRCLWLIEIKDYRQHRRTKPEDLATEVARKARDTLAGLVVARFQATEPKEQRFATAALGFRQIKVVLHLEQPVKHSKLFPRAIDPADILEDLKSLVKAIDAHPKVFELNRLNGCLWQVR